MTESIHIFELLPSTEHDRPQIDFERSVNARNDWATVDDVLRGINSVRAWPAIDIHVGSIDAKKWDCYAVPGAIGGLFSERAITALGIQSNQNFILLPARLDGINYYFLRCESPTDCLDIYRSAVTRFASDPSSIMEINRYAFHFECVPANSVFSIPQLPVLLATSAVVARMVAQKLRGIASIRLA